MAFTDGWRRAVRERKRSSQIVSELTELEKPYTLLRNEYPKFEQMTYEDFMILVRNSKDVHLSSHEIADIFERHGYNFVAFAHDVSRLIRDKHATLERYKGD